MKLRIYSEGACRGSPGPSAIAFIILGHGDRILEEHSEYVGVGTNNQAEYKALISALKSATDLGNEIICCLDSEPVVKQMKQMNREYEVSDPKMRTLWKQVVPLKKNFRKISFVYVPRTDPYIKRIDQLANQELDRVSSIISYNQTEGKARRQEVLKLSKKTKENILLLETNKGGYRLEVIAKFEDPYPVAYTIRISTPEGNKADYISTLEGFKNIGELLTALHYFAQTKLYPEDTERLRKVLTAENIKNFAEVLKSAKFSV